MRYLCLIYTDEDRLAALPAGERGALAAEHRAWQEALWASGRVVAGEAVACARAATVVRVRDGDVAATAGPFAATREELGGFLVIRARDLNDAVRVAAGTPCARLGGVEVRPVRVPERPHG